MTANYLVTGGCGFIGSNYINYMLDTYKDLRIVNLDCLNYCSSLANVRHTNDERYIFIKGNITDKDFISHILTLYRIDHIVHFAAQSHVDNSFDNSLQFTMDNVYGTHVLLQCAKEYGKLRRFIHFSTDEVYGEVDLNHPGCTEKSLLDPTNPYAATKAGAEFLVRAYYHSFRLPVIIIRCNNVYGPNQYPEKLIPRFIKLLRMNEKLTIHGTGQTRRNFIWAEDVARATDLVTREGSVNQIYNIGTSQEYSVMEVAAQLIALMKPGDQTDTWLTYVEDRPFNDFRYHLDCTKLSQLGWEPLYNDFGQNIKFLLKCDTY
jgi:dTDP-glucose 4,6-dehydratase